jgi:hypothetical protein
MIQASKTRKILGENLIFSIICYTIHDSNLCTDFLEELDDFVMNLICISQFSCSCDHLVD